MQIKNTVKSVVNLCTVWRRKATYTLAIKDTQSLFFFLFLVVC